MTVGDNSGVGRSCISGEPGFDGRVARLVLACDGIHRGHGRNHGGVPEHTRQEAETRWWRGWHACCRRRGDAQDEAWDQADEQCNQ